MKPGPDRDIDDNASFKMAAAAVKSIYNLINITQACCRAECDGWRAENSPVGWA